MRTATRRSLKNLSLSEHLCAAITRRFSFEGLASNNKQTHEAWCSKAVIYRSDKQQQQKKRRNPAENMQQQENCKTTFFYFSSTRQTFPSCWSTSLNLMQNVRWLLWKILKFAYCAWQSRPISQQKCISNAAACGANGSDSSHHSLLVSLSI